jgi:O-antigen ligase
VYLLALLVGAVVGLLTGMAPGMLSLLSVAVVGVLLGHRPVLLLVVFLVIEEVYPGSSYFAQAGPLLTTGYEIYGRIMGVTPALVLLGLGLVTLLVAKRDGVQARLRTHGTDGVGVACAAMILWSAGLSLSQEQRDFSPSALLGIALNTLDAISPWLLLLLAYTLTLLTLRTHEGRSRLPKALAVALIGKGALALVVLLSSGGTTIDGQRYLVYYDAALPMLAGAFVVGYLAASRVELPYRKLVFLAAAIIVVLSFRRAVWLAVAVGAVLLPLIRRRGVVVARLAILVCLLGVSLNLLPAKTRDAAFSRVSSAIEVVRGTGTEDSALNHEKDIERGYALARENPYVGVGVRAPQPRGFASFESSSLYIHSDFLQVWLTFGLPGLLVYASLLLVLGARAVRLLREHELGVLEASAAAFGLLLAVPAVTAPFVSTTVRWPIMIGLAGAIMRARLTGEAEDHEVSRGGTRSGLDPDPMPSSRRHADLVAALSTSAAGAQPATPAAPERRRAP